MQNSRYFVFEPFRLDVLDERLWRQKSNVPLGQKALAVLHHLVRQPGQLATKDELISAAWADTSVTDASLATAIRELRKALGDPARVPRFIETVHRRGYRFIAQVARADAPAVPAESISLPSESEVQSASVFPRTASSCCFVGREAELAQLNQWYVAAQEGARRITFVAGEAGIGKTELVETFVSGLAVQQGTIVARGQCIEHYGSGEAYLPILEAFGRLGRDTTLPVADILRQHAPSWLVHLPSLASAQELADSVPVRPEKMLRELADVLEILTAQRALILVLEDLHWSDTATLELLAYIARRRDPARLLIIATYRPIETLLQKHPLRKLIVELRAHPQCGELVLDYLSTDALERYLSQRCGPHSQVKELADVLHRRTGGLPLFFSAIVDKLKQLEGDLVRTEPYAFAQVIPTTVRQLIEHRFEELSDEDQAILEAASVMGETFCPIAIPTATSQSQESIGARCAAWAREGQFLSNDSTSRQPDQAVMEHYRFRHALVQEVIYARTSTERRAHLHRCVGHHLEYTHRKQASTIAAELAMHFEQGHEPRKAFLYLQQATRNALQKSAYSDALRHVTRAQETFNTLPGKGRERLQQELELLLLRGHVLKTTNGWGVKEVEHIYARARNLSKKLGDTPRLLRALWGLTGATFVQSELRKTRSLSQELLSIAKRQHDRVSCVVGHMELGGIALMLGELSTAHIHFRHADSFYDANQHRAHVIAFGADMGLFSRIWETHLTWHEGYPDQARAAAEKTLNRARELGHPFTLVITLAYAAMLHQFLRDLDVLERLTEEIIVLSSEHGFTYYRAWAEVLRGWSRAVHGAYEEGINDIQSGIQVLRLTAGIRLPYYLGLLAEAYTWSGRPNEGLEAVTDAFAVLQKSEEYWCEAELHRLHGELLQSGKLDRNTEAENCFQKAAKISRDQGAKSVELRATVSLARLWRTQGKLVQARQRLMQAKGWFDKGFSTSDMHEAELLLEELSSNARLSA